MTNKKSAKNKKPAIRKKTRTRIKRDWVLVDASKKSLGRLASGAAVRLMGKDRADFVPNSDRGSFVVVINAAKIRFDPKRAKGKFFYRHTRYPGGLRKISLPDLFQKDPRQVVSRAVANMIPANTFRAKRMRRLKVYPGAEHPHPELK